MDLENYITVGSVFVAIFSAWYSRNSFKLSEKNNIISQTPVLIPTFSGSATNYTVRVINDHKSGVAKNLSITLEKGKLSKTFSITNEFLSPSMGTYPLAINEDVDGCSFTISYLNIFDKKVLLSGKIHYINNLPDLQDIKFKIESVS
jgi:hypothetical protein